MHPMKKITPEQKLIIGAYLQSLMKSKNKNREELIQDGLSSSTIWRAMKGFETVEDVKYEILAKELGTSVQEILEKDSLKESERHLNLLEQQIECRVKTDEVETKLAKLLSNDCHYSYLTHYLAAKHYFYQRKFKKAELNFIKSIDSSRKSFDINGEQNILSLSLNGLSNIYYEKNEFRKALELVEEAIENFIIDGDRQKYYPMVIANKAVILNKLERINDARKEILFLWENRKDITWMTLRITVHDLFSALKKHEKSYHEAVNCLTEGIQIAQDNKVFDKLCELMTLLGEIHVELGNLEKAQDIFNLALSLQEKVSNQVLLVTTYTDIGKLYIKQGDYELAKQHFDKALMIADDHQYIGPRHVETLISVGDLLFKQNNESSIKPYEKALELSQIQGLDKSIEKLLLKLSVCYEGLDEEKSQLFLRQYGKMNFEKEMNL